MNAAFAFRMRMQPGQDAGPIPNRTILRRELERQVETLIAALDEMDGDPDLEPSLGWTRTMALGDHTDREEGIVRPVDEEFS